MNFTPKLGGLNLYLQKYQCQSINFAFEVPVIFIWDKLKIRYANIHPVLKKKRCWTLDSRHGPNID